MIRRLRHRSRTDESGFTLVELIVYSVLLIVIMGIAASLFLQMIYAQRDIVDMAQANNVAQVTFKELERDTRNAAVIRIKDGGNLMVMRTRVASDTNEDAWQCVGYFLDTSTDTLHITRSTSSAATSAALAQTTTAAIRTQALGWPVAREGFTQVGTSRPFGTIDGTLTDPGSVRLRLESDAESDRDPVRLSKTVSLRPQGSATLDCL
jgi:type II secretory pathway pseudopilin PulG